MIIPREITRDSKNYSFVIQGPVYIEYTHHTINSIRKSYPDAEIILSTYIGENLAYLSLDGVTLIENKDPGADNWNITRQIKSSYEGIIAANRDIVVKCRSDLLFLNANLKSHIGYWETSPNSVFTHRVYVGHLDSHKSWASWLALSDHMYCGLKGDLVRLFSIPYPAKDDQSGPERYLTKGYIESRVGPLDRSNDLSDQIIRDNFCVLHTEREAGYICQKYKMYKDKASDKLIMGNLDWQRLYYENI